MEQRLLKRRRLLILIVVCTNGEVVTASLAEPMVQASGASTIKISEPTLQKLRNAYLSEAAKAGKSRWGNMELEKANKMTLASPVKQYVLVEQNARNGSSAPPSLYDRINFGSQPISDNTSWWAK
mmetsp:Transcript_49879/g.74115  ORF Transcript_49879/g.74115 Transcript_49879/m.74115 type:complete len:125 (-) Transcript_49879:144-518(-)